MKHSLFSTKNKASFQNSVSFTLSSLVLACLLAACGGSSTNETQTSVEFNTAPVANAGADQKLFIGSTVTLSGAQSTDADDDTLSYSWNLSTLPNGSVSELSSDTEFSTSFIADVAGLYVVSLMVNDTSENSEIDSVNILVSNVTQGSTDGVLCDYSYDAYNDSDSVQLNSTVTWTCSDEERELMSNGIPDHAVGTFPNANNPNTITEQSVAESYSLAPVETTAATTLGGPAGPTGYVLNGVKIDANTAGSCDDSGDNCSLIGNEGNWHIEALGHNSFNFGTDDNNAHVQPGGVYHYHGMPEGFVTKQGGDNTTMTIIGWAADGFPIYARYGYSIASDNTSPLKSMTGSYQLVTEVSESRPSVNTYALGTFGEDWEYVAGSGDLDECNGRVGVTPEFPAGIYHYYATDSYPYFQRCVKGEVEVGGVRPPPQ
ncbi:YHYH protein [Pseudocolwellia agarivorans]|uniref:YHYH protein n=1 Tax=Pseudocolwellia agarivorans TaxID=1911682 RepID=UPI001C37B2B5|nr:YHYH protein [Pseudocolwellia agarivorans]